MKHVNDFLQQEQHLKGKSLDSDLDLKPMIVEVGEGDALYIPPYWLHSVVPVDDEVGFTVAFCWASPWHKLGDLSSFFVRKLYRQALWPLKGISLAVPFIACRACTAHVIRKFSH